LQSLSFNCIRDCRSKISISTTRHNTDIPQRGLIGPIISRFENRGFKLAAIKLISPSKEHLEKHYEDLSDKPFFPGLIACIYSLPHLFQPFHSHHNRHGLRPRMRHGLGRP
jgi:nucleoside diphosphate kinase